MMPYDDSPYRLYFLRHFAADDLRFDTLEEAAKAAIGMFYSGEGHVLGISKGPPHMSPKTWVTRHTLKDLFEMWLGNIEMRLRFPTEAIDEDSYIETHTNSWKREGMIG